MTNILDGLQFRTLKTQFPSYSNGTMRVEDDNYFVWGDVVNLNETFPTGTQFRMRPVYKYEVNADGVVKTYGNKDTAMSMVATSLEAGTAVRIFRVDETKDLTEFLFNKNVQWRTPSGDKWQSVQYLTLTNLSQPIQLRIRPDNYFGVKHNTLNGTEITFDDSDRLAKYVDSQIRTGNANLTVRAINYV